MDRPVSAISVLSCPVVESEGRSDKRGGFLLAPGGNHESPFGIHTLPRRSQPGWDFSGRIVVYGLINSGRLDLDVYFSVVDRADVGHWLPVSLPQAAASHVLGGLSLLALAIAIYARYSRRMTGGWRRASVISAILALYFNVFVLIVQLFAKVPALHELAPAQSETPFKVAQLVTLAVFLALGYLSARNFHVEQLSAA